MGRSEMAAFKLAQAALDLVEQEEAAAQDATIEAKHHQGRLL
jgi:hypothetical protein